MRSAPALTDFTRTLETAARLYDTYDKDIEAAVADRGERVRVTGPAGNGKLFTIRDTVVGLGFDCVHILAPGRRADSVSGVGSAIDGATKPVVLLIDSYDDASDPDGSLGAAFTSLMSNANVAAVFVVDNTRN